MYLTHWKCWFSIACILDGNSTRWIGELFMHATQAGWFIFWKVGRTMRWEPLLWTG